jgi:hypothetical protein
VRKLAFTIFLTLAACGDPTGQRSTSDQSSLSQLDASAVPDIKGNNGHNILAHQGRLDRAMGLATVVKAVEGKRYCSPERTFYRGRAGSESFWAIQCHDGTEYEVAIKKNGDGGVVNCAILDRVDPKNGCWQPLPNR